MSTDGPINLKQDRRQWLKASATVLGASLLPLPAISSEIPDAETAPQGKPVEPRSTARFFTPVQYTLVEELSETIIPADSHSGGAKAAKVADYIEQVLGESVAVKIPPVDDGKFVNPLPPAGVLARLTPPGIPLAAIAGRASSAGIVVVSGMARGLDALDRHPAPAGRPLRPPSRRAAQGADLSAHPRRAGSRSRPRA